MTTRSALASRQRAKIARLNSSCPAKLLGSKDRGRECRPRGELQPAGRRVAGDDQGDLDAAAGRPRSSRCRLRSVVPPPEIRTAMRKVPRNGLHKISTASGDHVGSWRQNSRCQSDAAFLLSRKAKRADSHGRDSNSSRNLRWACRFISTQSNVLGYPSSSPTSCGHCRLASRKRSS